MEGLVKLDVKNPTTLFGLQNDTGISCHFNAVTQALLSCTGFVETMRKHVDKYTENAIVHEFLQLIDGDETLRTARPIFEEVKKITQSRDDKINKLYGKTHECADETLKLLIESIGDSMLDRFKMKYKKQIVCPNCEHKSDPIYDIMSYFEITGREKDLNNNKKFEEHLLRQVSIVEGYTCEKCKITSDCRMEHYLHLTSEIFVIVMHKHTSRYGGVGKKNVFFPLGLKFPGLPKGSIVKYELVAQVDHTGTDTSGHYTATCRRGADTWRLNDSTIGRGTLAPLPTTYLLFYHLV